jgi:hypothetical protein
MTSMTGSMGPAGRAGNKLPSGYKVGQLQNFTPEQMQLFQQQFSHVGPESYLSKLASGDQSFFNEIEAPAHRQFQGAQGQLASRFSGMGMGGRKSSGFQNEATAGASNFAEQLQSQRQGLQRQAIQDLMGMSNTLLGQRPYESFLYEKPKKQSGWGGAIGAGVGGLGGFLLGGPGGAMAGAQLGYGLGNSFGGGGGGGQGGGFGAGVDLSPFKNQDFAYNFANHFSPGI